ncbi:MAG: PTS system nitrogen regulatory IIA component [Polyangiales bacterium]|jgi:PTS system nitrogen regulatory IIA component
MALANYLSEARIAVLADAPDKSAAIHRAASLLAHGTELDESSVLHVLLEREELATTGVGSGVAMPHGRMNVPDMRAALLVIPRGVAFDAIDGRDVQLVLGLLAPSERPTQLLRVLADASRALRDEDTRDQLIASVDAGAVMRILEELA